MLSYQDPTIILWRQKSNIVEAGSLCSCRTCGWLTMIRSSGDGTDLSMTAVASKAPGTGTGSVLTVPAKLTVAVALCRWALCRPSLLTPSHGKPQTWTNILLLLAQWPFRLPFTFYDTFTKT